MAAILPFLEVGPEDRSEAAAKPQADLAGLEGLSPAEYLRRLEATDEGGDLGGLGDAQKPPENPLTKSHTELSALVWKRQIITDEIAKQTFTLEDSGKEVSIIASPGFDVQLVPWWKISGEKLQTKFALFSTNKKMKCPTFDLPAGSDSIGGACPGAVQGQSVSQISGKLLDGRQVDLQTAVCQRCYASGGKYSEVSVQLRELVIYAFVRRMMLASKGEDKEVVLARREQLREVLVFTILNRLSHLHSKEAFEKFKIKPVRVHSSGDFFQPDYLHLWLDVARDLQNPDVENNDPTIRLWAPTRTNVAWPQEWKKLAGKIPSNFSIRASAYHVGDTAPDLVDGASKGTSVLIPAQSEDEKGKKFDWQCPVYAVEKASDKTCRDAIGPDGKPGCRVCWIKTDWRVNYTLH